MPVNVLTIAGARSQLSTILEGFRSGDRETVYLGADRQTEAIIIPVEVYDELTGRRRKARADTRASLRGDGLEPSLSEEAEAIADEWMHGRISTAEMEEQIAALYGLWRP